MSCVWVNDRFIIAFKSLVLLCLVIKILFCLVIEMAFKKFGLFFFSDQTKVWSFLSYFLSAKVVS